MLFVDLWQEKKKWRMMQSKGTKGMITAPECIASLDDLQQCWQLLRSFALTKLINSIIDLSH